MKRPISSTRTANGLNAERPPLRAVGGLVPEPTARGDAVGLGLAEGLADTAGVGVTPVTGSGVEAGVDAAPLDGPPELPPPPPPPETGGGV